MKQIKQETGRSMVEMLGVLAVIGVLSVGGISGYTLAMNKHRANSVAADLMKRAVVISAQRQLGQPNPNMDGFGETVGEYEIDQTVDTSAADKFAMTVQAVPEEVCEKILALDWDNATISPDKAEDCNGGDMTFTYNNDLSPVTGSNAGGSTGGEGGETEPDKQCAGEQPACQKCDTTTGEWVADETLNGYSCDAGVCTDGTCGCPDGPDAEPGELIGGTCCWRGMKYSIADLDYTDWDPQFCGCPPVWNAPAEGTPLAYNEEYNQCCVNGYSYHVESGVYDLFSPDICGCPYKDYEGGMMNIELHDFVNCCSDQNGWMGLWNPENGYDFGQEGYVEDKEGVCP